MIENLVKKDEDGNQMIAGTLTVLGIIPITQPVNKDVPRGVDDNKIIYTVPVDKVLNITAMFISSMDGKMFIEFQHDGTLIWSAGVYLGSPNAAIVTSPQTPFGPFSAGEVIRGARVDGNANKFWAAGFTGFLRDA